MQSRYRLLNGLFALVLLAFASILPSQAADPEATSAPRVAVAEMARRVQRGQRPIAIGQCFAIGQGHIRYKIRINAFVACNQSRSRQSLHL